MADTGAGSLMMVVQGGPKCRTLQRQSRSPLADGLGDDQMGRDSLADEQEDDQTGGAAPAGGQENDQTGGAAL